MVMGMSLSLSARGVTEGDHVGGAVVGDGVGDGVGEVVEDAGGVEVGDGVGGGLEGGEVGGGRDGGVGHEAHGPGGVVVGHELGVGIDLLAEEGLGEAAVGLVELDDEGAGGEVAVGELESGLEAADFDALHAKDVDDEGDTGHVLLVGGDDVGEGRLGGAGVDGIFRLGVEVFEDGLGERGGELESGEDAGFSVVGVVAHGPDDVAIGRVGAEPGALADVSDGAAAGGRDEAMHGGGAAVAEDLVEAPEAVVVGAHGGDVAGGPAVDVAVVPDAGHAVLGELGAISKLENQGSSAQVMGSTRGFWGAWPEKL